MTSDTMIREATEKDIPRIVELADVKRRQYETYQSVFHRSAKDASEIHARHLKTLLGKDQTIFLVFEEEETVLGFVCAEIRRAPPVYDPGGDVCYVDDFAVSEPSKWPTVGQDLLQCALDRGKERGAVMGVVVCGPQDERKRNALTAMNFDVASEWFVKPL